MNEIINTNLICIKSGSTMNEASQMMKEKRIRHLPIVNRDNRIMAMLSGSDMADTAVFGDLPVDLFSSYPVKWVLQDTPLWRVALDMIENKISSILLCDTQQRAVGIITSEDLLYRFSQMLKEKEKTDAGWNALNAVSTAGEFFRKLADIGI